MLDSVDQVSLRNLVLAALVVWGVFAAVWYLLLHDEPPLRTPAGSRPAVGSVSPPLSREAPSALEDSAAGGQAQGSPPGVVLDADTPKETPRRRAEPGEQPAPPAVSARAQEVQASTAPPAQAAPPSGGSGEYTIQVGAFRSSEGAAALRDRLRREGWSTEVVEAADLYRVFVGHYPSSKAARRDLERLRQQGFEAFVRRR
ncbi:MAG: hypothetical protein Kow00109_12380 [Acidobacteriota bacterium]